VSFLSLEIRAFVTAAPKSLRCKDNHINRSDHGQATALRQALRLRRHISERLCIPSANSNFTYRTRNVEQRVVCKGLCRQSEQRGAAATTVSMTSAFAFTLVAKLQEANSKMKRPASLPAFVFESIVFADHSAGGNASGSASGADGTMAACFSR